jgi:hypothetical protein
MKKMQHSFICAMIAISLFYSTPVNAGPAEDYQEARLLYLTIAASIAAYPGGDSDVVMSVMRRDGWEIVSDSQKNEAAPARILFAQKEIPGTPTSYLLAIAGTSTLKDLELDLKFNKVYFAGKTAEEFEENSGKKQKLPDQVPMVHQGFHQYTQAVISAEIRIADLLLAHPDRSLYLTGHSAGGSAAVLLGAKLINMGVRPEQLKIVTFGAPPVGNAVFAEKYSPILDLKRVVLKGDVIPNLLKIFVRGYRQFGREILWTAPGLTFDAKHYPNIFMECAVKNYYDTRLAATRSGVKEAVVLDQKPSIEGKRLYVAAIHNDLHKALAKEFPYMREILLDQYREMIPAYVIGEPDAVAPYSLQALRTQAAAVDCDRMVIVNIWGRKQDDPATYSGGLLTKEDRVYDLLVIEQTVVRTSDGTVLDWQTYQKGSKYFPPLIALASAAVSMSGDSATWSGQREVN